MNLQLLRQHIRSSRERKGLSCNTMAEKLFMSTRSYLRLENGETKNISLDVICKLAEALEIPAWQLLALNESHQPERQGQPAETMPATLQQQYEKMIADLQCVNGACCRIIQQQQELIHNLQSILSQSALPLS